MLSFDKKDLVKGAIYLAEPPRLERPLSLKTKLKLLKTSSTFALQ
jgi:hypothetical protein